MALVRTAVPIALETPSFVRHFYRGLANDYRNYRVTCHGFHTQGVTNRCADLRLATFVVGNVQNGTHQLTSGLGLRQRWTF